MALFINKPRDPARAQKTIVVKYDNPTRQQTGPHPIQNLAPGLIHIHINVAHPEGQIRNRVPTTLREDAG